jgi:hypothetical protein
VWTKLTEYSTQFDRLSKSKTVEGLYPFLHSSSLPQFFSFTEQSIIRGQTESKDKRWYADQQLIVLRQHLTTLLSEHKACINNYIEFLCRSGFFTSENLAKEQQTMLREKLLSALSILLNDTSNVWPTTAVLEIDKLEESLKKVVKLDSQIKKIRKSGLKSMKSLRKKVAPFLTGLTSRE